MSDPVLRAWLIGRMTGKYTAPASFTPHHPPYLQGLLPLSPERPDWAFPCNKIESHTPKEQLTLKIHGVTLSADPSRPEQFFDVSVSDIETSLARHRFAWLPLMDHVDTDWLAAIWHVWRHRYMEADDWAWHPYTAAERAINLLDAVRRFGSPDDLNGFAGDLAVHATAIASRLEYFGAHDTSNHLANNGRGLYRLGLALGLPSSRDIGFEILSHEAERILLNNGTLREGSTHYHLLYVRNYLDAWLAAKRHDRHDDAARFATIAGRMLDIAKALIMPGGMPLIGDISPDSPPHFLAGLADGVCTWTRSLNENEQRLVKDLCESVSPATHAQLAADGWVRKDFGRWSMLAACPNAGWPFMPGHAHQDITSAEIHLDGHPLFVDPGRGAYGETDDAAFYRSAKAHGVIMIDDTDPYPANKPYYSDDFRQSVAGAASAETTNDSVTIRHGGYQRLGIDTVSRSWAFDDTGMHITDIVEGSGSHQIERAFITPHDVHIENNTAIIGGKVSMRAASSSPEVQSIMIWHAYGEGKAGSRIVFHDAITGPFQGQIDIEVIA